jgi:predicted SAM-dependent methyltransferase
MQSMKLYLMSFIRSRPKLYKSLVWISSLRTPSVWLGLKPIYSVRLFFYMNTKLNIGSGKRRWPGWICLDEIQDIGVVQFSFTGTSRFPIEDNSMDLVYSSHFLEHIDDISVGQVLSESFRCLRPNGQLILKLPDFDMFIKSYLANDFSYFSDIGVDSVLHTWTNHGITDSISSRFAMMFCGYMDAGYGVHFTGRMNLRSNDAFHGPPRITPQELAFMVSSNTESPHKVAALLKQIATEEQQVYKWNHQNAWSRQEMESLLQNHGFIVSTLSSSDWKSFKNKIPDFTEVMNMSMYLYAVKPGIHN